MVMRLAKAWDCLSFFAWQLNAGHDAAGKAVKSSCRGSQLEARQLAQALQRSEEALEEAEQDAAAHEDAAEGLFEELDQTRAARASLEGQLVGSRVCLRLCTMVFMLQHGVSDPRSVCAIVCLDVSVW